jgi:hypothetical protein
MLSQFHSVFCKFGFSNSDFMVSMLMSFLDEMISLIEYKGIGLKTMEQCYKLVIQSQQNKPLFD